MMTDSLYDAYSKPKSCNGGRLCLIVGAGAIGKAVAGYVFSQLGYQVVFADIQDDIIADINHRRSYVIHCAQTGKPIENVCVRGVTACHANSRLAREMALEADIICTAVGPSGMKCFLPLLASWIIARLGTHPQRLHLMLFENDAECKSTVATFIGNAIGFHPDWLTVVETSIERIAMSKGDVASGINVIAEQFIPVIAPCDLLTGLCLGDNQEYFMLVGCVKPYYYRKLYTNNLGHAAMGFTGIRYGYTDTVSAMGDSRVVRLLTKVFDESGCMLVSQFGFTAGQMEAHIAALLQRYRNSEMNDSLRRLVRDPVRKLGRTERIIGALRRCLTSGIQPEGIMEVLLYALTHDDPGDPSTCEIADVVANHGVGEVLIRICGIPQSDHLHGELCSRYESFIHGKRFGVT